MTRIVKVGLDEGERMPVKHPAAADISILMDGRTAGTTFLSELVTKVEPGATLKPSHSHKDIEEIIYVLEGEGEVWIDGETCKMKQGDSVLFPVNSQHTVRNTGTGTLAMLCIFSSPQYRRGGAYLTHEENVF